MIPVDVVGRNRFLQRINRTRENSRMDSVWPKSALASSTYPQSKQDTGLLFRLFYSASLFCNYRNAHWLSCQAIVLLLRVVYIRLLSHPSVVIVICWSIFPLSIAFHRSFLVLSIYFPLYKLSFPLRKASVCIGIFHFVKSMSHSGCSPV